jgi:hypothetical protein
MFGFALSLYLIGGDEIIDDIVGVMPTGSAYNTGRSPRRCEA